MISTLLCMAVAAMMGAAWGILRGQAQERERAAKKQQESLKDEREANDVHCLLPSNHPRNWEYTLSNSAEIRENLVRLIGERGKRVLVPLKSNQPSPLDRRPRNPACGQCVQKEACEIGRIFSLMLLPHNSRYGDQKYLIKHERGIVRHSERPLKNTI